MAEQSRSYIVRVPGDQSQVGLVRKGDFSTSSESFYGLGIRT
jgi:hypothetical protein